MSGKGGVGGGVKEARASKSFLILVIAASAAAAAGFVIFMMGFLCELVHSFASYSPHAVSADFYRKIQ